MYRVITLTSIPPRFTYLYFNLKKILLNNEVDEIRLYLPKKYRRFPEYRGDIPVVPAGVTICQIDNDFGPATKLLPAISDFRNNDMQILFCDDDVLYPKNFSKNLFEIQNKRSDQVVATFGRQVSPYLMNNVKPYKKRIYAQEINIEYDVIYRFKRILGKIFRCNHPNKKPIIFPGYVDILWGVCGAVVRPFFFDDEVFNIPDEAWAVDDVWLSAQLARKNIPIYCPWRLPWPIYSRASDVDSLLNLCFLGSARQELNRKAALWCQKKYGIWM